MFGVGCCESKTKQRGYFSSDPWSWNLKSGTCKTTVIHVPKAECLGGRGFPGS
jgi:hypothetical protein